MRNVVTRFGALGLIAAFVVMGAGLGWGVAGVVQRNSRMKKWRSL